MDKVTGDIIFIYIFVYLSRNLKHASHFMEHITLLISNLKKTLIVHQSNYKK